MSAVDKENVKAKLAELVNRFEQIIKSEKEATFSEADVSSKFILPLLDTLGWDTKNIDEVKEFLGHRNLDTTLLYIQLEKALFQTDSDEFMVKAVKDPEEIKGLLEVGYEYICTKDDLLFFRKRK
jgi:hydroxymethylpyrimidine/phosphomethylpyrimidine kinase